MLLFKLKSIKQPHGKIKFLMFLNTPYFSIVFFFFFWYAQFVGFHISNLKLFSMKKYIRSTQLLSDKNILVIITFFSTDWKRSKKSYMITILVFNFLLKFFTHVIIISVKLISKPLMNNKVERFHLV